MDSPAAPNGGRWSFSVQGAPLLFFAAFATAGLCASAVIRKRRMQTGPSVYKQANATEEESATGWRETKNAVIGSLHSGDMSQAAEPGARVAVAETAAKGRREEQRGMGCTPPLWQRRILMGERCEMPKFSGLILYDERGRPLTSNDSDRAAVPQEKPAPSVSTLQDLI